MKQSDPTGVRYCVALPSSLQRNANRGVLCAKGTIGSDGCVSGSRVLGIQPKSSQPRLPEIHPRVRVHLLTQGSCQTALLGPFIPFKVNSVVSTYNPVSLSRWEALFEAVALNIVRKHNVLVKSSGSGVTETRVQISALLPPGSALYWFIEAGQIT